VVIVVDGAPGVVVVVETPAVVKGVAADVVDSAP
jgi:hypothetical protein